MISFLRIFKKEIIGPEDDPYLHRIHLTPWRWWKFPFGFYVHVFFRPDAEPWLHDHPRRLLSLILYGGYTEERGTLVLKTLADGAIDFPTKFAMARRQFVRKRGDWVDLNLDVKHKIVELHRVPTVTFLVIKRKKERTWGFWIEENDEVKFVCAERYFNKTDVSYR